MTNVVTPEALYFGAPASLLIDGVEMGATLDDPKVGFDLDIYAPRFKNAGGPVMGATRVRAVTPKLTCLVNELSAAKIAHALPGATRAVGTAAETVGGEDTTLAADSAIGATNIKVADVADISVGDFLRVGDAGETEIRQVTVVGTSGSGGTGVTLDSELLLAHDTGDQVREVDDAGTSIFSWSTNIAIPDDQYVDVQAIGVGKDGRELRVLIKNALITDSFEFAMGDSDFYGVPMVFKGNYDPANPTSVPFELEVG